MRFIFSPDQAERMAARNARQAHEGDLIGLAIVVCIAAAALAVWIYRTIGAT